jgi:hypothetical protein
MISLRSVVSAPADGGGVFLSLFPYDMSCEYGIGCVASPSAQGASPRVKRAVAF